jgi:hypothetical protein
MHHHMLSSELVGERQRSLRREADRGRLLATLRRAARERRAAEATRTDAPPARPILLRVAGPADAPAVARLAALDSRPVPEGAVLLAELDGTLIAARPLDLHEEPLADPFRHTEEARALLELWERQLLGRRRPRRPVRGSLARNRVVTGGAAAS